MNRLNSLLAIGLMVPSIALGQVKTPEDIEVAPHWIYDDVPAAFAAAKQSGKPILALFR